MKYMTHGFFIYAIANFIIFMIIAPSEKQVGHVPPSAAWRGFSGHWMLFYSAGLAILSTAHRKGVSNLEPKCPNGHGVGFGDQFCSTCGAPLGEERR
jgi:hypothetical protein